MPEKKKGQESAKSAKAPIAKSVRPAESQLSAGRSNIIEVKCSINFKASK